MARSRWRTRRLAVVGALTAGLLISAGGVVAEESALAAECVETVLLGQACTTDSGVGWHYSAEERAFFLQPASSSGVSGEPSREWTEVPVCAGNQPGALAVACAASACTTVDGEPGVLQWVFSRPVSPPGSAWTLEDTQCRAAPRRVDLADIEAEVRRVIEDKFREIAEPSVELAPATGGLVNLPVLAWTDDPGEVTLQIEQPLPGEIRATPEYAWEWSNGQTSSGSGRPYTSSVSPTAQPDHYVHAVYRQRGPAEVVLTVTWSGDVTVPGLPPVDIAPLVYTAPASFAVREARTELVDPAGAG